MEKKILVKIQGGLGNQLFQYACAYALGIKYSAAVYLDLDDYRKGKNREAFTLRKYELDRFNISHKVFKEKPFSRYRYPLSLKNTFKKKLKSFANKSSFVTIDEDNFGLLHSAVNRHDIYLDGYWQSERYFQEVRKQLLAQFAPTQLMGAENEILLSDIRNNSNSVSIHVRRGDYVTNERYTLKYGFCGIDYYLKAIEWIKSKIAGAMFFIFSDDPEWVKAHLKVKDAVYVDHHNDGWQDLMLMKSCRHHIVANSTFSWWAAWLSENPDKIVVAPKKWYHNEGLNRERKDLVPKSWVRL